MNVRIRRKIIFEDIEVSFTPSGPSLPPPPTDTATPEIAAPGPVIIEDLQEEEEDVEKEGEDEECESADLQARNIEPNNCAELRTVSIGHASLNIVPINYTGSGNATFGNVSVYHGSGDYSLHGTNNAITTPRSRTRRTNAKIVRYRNGFKCTECQKKFTRRENCRFHILRSHNL